MPRLTAILLLFIILVSFKGGRSNIRINWINIADAEAAGNIEKRPILIDLYTDWCAWCKVMDKKTYTNKNLAAYVHEKFYAVKINAETRATINWRGRTFNFSQAYKANEFALYVTGGRLSFPTTVIIPADGSAPQAIPGYLKPNELELFLKYYGEKLNTRIPVDEYMWTAKSKW